MGGQVKPIARPKGMIHALDGKGDLATDHPQAFVMLVPMPGIGRAGNIVPADGIVTFMMELGFRFFLGGGRQTRLPANHADRFLRFHLMEIIASG